MTSEQRHTARQAIDEQARAAQPAHDEIEAALVETLGREQAEALDLVTRAQAHEDNALAEVQESSDVWHTLASKDPDAPDTADERDAARKMDAAISAATAATASREAAERKHAYVASDTHRDQLRNKIQVRLDNRKEKTTMAAATTSREDGTISTRAAIADVAKHLRGPISVQEFVDRVLDRPVRLSGRTPRATVQAVMYTAAKRGEYIRVVERGVVDALDQAEAKPVEKPGKTTEAKPLPKKTQAAGTSRGGTGRKNGTGSKTGGRKKSVAKR